MAVPLTLRRCDAPDCDAVFQPKHKRQRCCSEACGKRRWALAARAAGKVYRQPWDDRRRDAYHRRRARKKAAATGEPVLREEIAARDGWICYLCEQTVDSELTWPHPFSPSLDHVIPLSRGGAHGPANVRLTHLLCNTSKGARLSVG
ncbi:HNH endonuclease [Streptomyces albidoflavus]|uniref:HNH endonuclease n=1 Tax=Streptomyces sp. CBG31 TaxID=2762623 RepID=UPI0035A8A169